MFWNTSDGSGHISPGGLTLWVYDVKKSHRPNGFYFAAEIRNAHSALTHVPNGRFIAIGPRQLARPVLALVAFLTWKLGWVIVARRKRRREHTMAPR